MTRAIATAAALVAATVAGCIVLLDTDRLGRSRGSAADAGAGAGGAAGAGTPDGAAAGAGAGTGGASAGGGAAGGSGTAGASGSAGAAAAGGGGASDCWKGCEESFKTSSGYFFSKLWTCACTAAACQSACAATACGPSHLFPYGDSDCFSCLVDSVKQGGACGTLVGECNANGNCDQYAKCLCSTCQVGAGGCT